MATLRLRCKSRAGQSNLGTKLTENSTLSDLLSDIEQSVGVSSRELEAILVGFPPKTVHLDNREILLRDIPLKSGDTVILKELSKVAGHQNGSIQDSKPAPSQEESKLGLQVTSVPPNHSCLFTSIALCLNNGVLDLDAAKPLRQKVADIVLSDPNYSEVILGKSREDYAAWILKEDSWGGGVELAILSSALEIIITVLDTISKDGSNDMQHFGEGSYFSNRIFIIYDGTHYDPIIQQTEAGVKSMFAVCDEDAVLLVEAHELALKVKKDRGCALLQCQICGAMLKGAQEAGQHTVVTKHDKFQAKQN